MVAVVLVGLECMLTMKDRRGKCVAHELFSGVRLKRARAFELLHSLEKDCNDWASGVKIDLDHSVGDGGWHVWSAGPLPSPPAEFGIRVGEVAYQLRSALDHAAHAMILANGGNTTKGTYFPVSLTEQAWKSQSKPYLRGASDQSLETAMKWQPFWQQPLSPHADMLAALNEIALVDKHRQLVPAAAGLGFQNLHVRVQSPVSARRDVSVVGRSPDEPVRLDTSEWVFKALVSHSDAPAAPDLSASVEITGMSKVAAIVQFRTHFPYELVFGIDAFSSMAKHARRVLLDLERSI